MDQILFDKIISLAISAKEAADKYTAAVESAQESQKRYLAVNSELVNAREANDALSRDENRMKLSNEKKLKDLDESIDELRATVTEENKDLYDSLIRKMEIEKEEVANSDLVFKQVHAAHRKQIDEAVTKANENEEVFRNEYMAYNTGPLGKDSESKYSSYKAETIQALKDNLKDATSGVPVSDEIAEYLADTIYTDATKADDFNTTLINKVNTVFHTEHEYKPTHIKNAERILTLLADHQYELHHGFGVEVKGKKYSDGAADVHFALTYAVHDKISSEKYELLCQEIRDDLSLKTKTTFGFFGLGARDKTTVKLYRDIMALLDVNNASNPDVDMDEEDRSTFEHQ